ncbi:MAG: response regulator [Lachnospiraceae bacterium]|nr:response regulator [Lachnospiraceae bacterium]
MADTKKILIGDDSILARKQIKDIIASIRADVEFFDATNGQEAVDKFIEIKPDMVFLDIVMPVKDGIDATKGIMEADSDAVIVIASSIGTQTQVKAAIDAGARDFIQKPIRSEQIENVIKNYL